MKLSVTSLENYDYASIVAITMEGEGYKVKLELPQKVLDEVGWRPSVGDGIEMRLESEAGNLDEWDIVLSGTLLKRERGLVAYSFGGLVCTIRGRITRPKRKVYLKLRLLR